jgi:hypothetical protein
MCGLAVGRRRRKTDRSLTLRLRVQQLHLRLRDSNVLPTSLLHRSPPLTSCRLLILGFSALDLAEPFHQRFSLNNESLQYPFADPERITAAWAGVIACLFPLVVIIFWTMLIDGMYSHRKPPSNRSRIMSGPWQISDRLWEMNCGILGLGLSVAGAICVTNALKNATGKPRPDVIARYVSCPGRGGAAAGERY